MLLAALLAAAYVGTAASFARSWSGRDDYSHGWLVPLVSLWLVWRSRERLARLAPSPSPFLGLPVVLAGALMILAGKVGSIVMLQQLSVLVVMPGLVLALLGPVMLAQLWLPLAFLALMVPSVMDTLLGGLHWPFQLFGAAAAAALLRVLGVPVLRQEQFLMLPGITLEVANICSGVRYLVSILALGLPLAFLTQTGWPRRLALVAGAVGIGVVANPVRIALIALWTNRYGLEQLHGPGHVLQGFSVAVAGFSAIFALAWALARGRRRSPPASPPVVGDRVDGHAGRREVAAWAGSFAILGLVSTLSVFHHPRPVPLKWPLFSLALNLGGWETAGVWRGDLPLALTGADEELARVYRRGVGAEVVLYAGYFSFQEQGRELVYYRSKEVYDASSRTSVSLGGGRELEVNQAVLGEGPDRTLLIYWYDLGGRPVADRVAVKALTTFNGLVRGRTSGALVALRLPLGNGGSVEEGRETAGEFLRAAFPALSSHLSGGAAG